jgi:chitodextrinase
MNPRFRQQLSASAAKVVLTLAVIASAIEVTPRQASAQTAIAFVQVNSATPQSPSTTVTVRYASAQTAGDLNVVVVGWNDATAQVQSVVDSLGNSYQRAVGPTVRAGAATQSIYYAADIAAAAANTNTVTVTFAPAAVYPDVRIAEYRGIATVSPVDVTAAAQGSSTSSSSGAVTTTNANDLLVGANTVQTNTTGAGTSFTSRVITNPDGDILEDLIVTSTGTYSATSPVSSGWWIMQMVAFRAAGSVADTQPPTAPGTPVPTVISSSQINLIWSAATDNVGVTGYLVERCAGAGCSSFAQVGTPTTTSFNDTGLTASTSYSYRVRATDTANNLSAYSAIASAVTQTASDTQPPTAPGSPVPTVFSSTQINVTWPAATDNVGVTGYLVERCSGAGCSSFAQVGTPAGAGFNDTGLTASTSYSYRVRATDAANNLGPYSVIATATTQAAPDTQPPTAPGTPVLTAISSSQINLTWPAATDNVGVTGYLVERCAGAGCSAFAQVAAPTSTGFNDTGLTASTSYSYRVRATDAANNLGPYSPIASATTLTSSIVLIQHTSRDAGSTTSSSLALSTNTTSGNWIAVVIRAGQAGQAFSVTDTRGNTYRQAVQLNETTDGTTLAIYYAENISGGATTVTVADSISGGTLRFAVLEYAGLALTNSLDATATGQGTSTTPATASATLASAGDLVIGAVSAANPQTFTAGGGWTDEERVPAAPNTKLAVEDQVKSTAGSVSATGTLSSSDSWGAIVAGFRAAGSAADTQPPTAPGTPMLTVISSSQINLTWSAATDNVGVSGYLVERCPGAGCSSFAQVGTSTTTSFNDTGLTASTSYSYRVRATDAANNLGPYSAVASAPTQAGADTQPPTAPGAPVPTAVSSSQINLTWPTATDNVGVTGYLVERCAGAGCSSFAPVGAPAAASFNDTGLTASTSYSYRVRATDAANNLGPYSATATAVTQAASDTQPPTAPGTPVPTVVSSTQINLTWPAATDNVGVTGYFIERCDGAGCSTFGQVGTSATTSYSSGGLSASTTYNYRVRATDAAGNLGPYSATASASTSNPAPITLVQHSSKDGGVTTSSSLAFAANTTAGNWIAVVIRAGKTGQTIAVSDTRGNTYQEAVQLNETTDSTTLAIYYAENISGGATTVTVADSINGGTLRFAILEYAGVALTNSFDSAATGEGTSTTAATPSASLATAGDLVIGGLSTSNGRTVTAGSGWTLQDRVPAAPNTKLAVEDQVSSTAGSVAATATLSSSDSWGAVLASFRAGTIAPSPDLTLTKTHAGSFVQGQTGATYTLTVSNIGNGDSSGVVAVNDTLPSGLTATGMGGAGWTCTLAPLSCTRSDALLAGSNFPDIAVTVNVSFSAPASVTNSASVSGGGETNTANDAAADITAIGPAAPDTEPPSAPGTLTTVAVSGIQVNLSWGPATDNVGVTGYRVERCQDAGCTNFVKLATPVTNSYSDNGLVPGTSYSYVVRAVDGANNLGPYSNTSSVTTLATNPSLVAAYSFNENTGSTVSDSSSNDNTGTIANATWTGAGRYGNALVFNGSSSRITIADAPSLHLGTGATLEAWVNPSTTSASWADIIYKGNDNYYLDAVTGAPVAGVTLSTSTNSNTFGPSALPTNTWTHLAETFDGSTIRLYVNGVQVGSTALNGTLLTSTNPLEIGSDHIYGQYFQGTIDEVRIYNVALTPSQIQADMASPVGVLSPIVSLSTASLDFGTQSTGTTSSAQSVVLNNIGGASLAVTSISVSGPNANEFTLSTTCGSTVPPTGSCSITVTFTPTVAGTRAASIVISDNAEGTPHTISLTGVGAGFSISPRTTAITSAQTQQFTTTGGGSGSMTWSVDGVNGGTASTGTITSAGLYSPPATAGVHTVTVTTADLLQSSSASIYVTNYPGTTTHHNDNSRTGQNLSESVLTPANVTPSSFGKLFSYALDGVAMASPLYVANVTLPDTSVHNIVYVATQHDSVYAFDADGRTPSPLWQRSFISPAVGAGVTTVPSDDTGECCDIAPEIGITGTPVIDPATGTLYVVAKTKEGPGNNATYVQRLHALDITTGAEKLGGPVILQASVPGTGAGSQGGNVPFDALRENQRPALLLSNGVVYIGFGGHGDVQPYHGWVLGYDATTLQQTMKFNVSPDDSGGGIWQANGGPAADAAGNIYFVTGNGGFDADVNGRDYGDSFIKINTAGGVVDYFTPHDQASISSLNFDLGAAGPLLLPDQSGSHPHLVVSAGKNNTVYLVDRDNMGHYNANDDSQIVQSLVDIFPYGTPEPGNYSGAVFFNGKVYFGPIADNIQAFTLNNGLLSTSATSRSTEIYAYPGATMAISANGTANGILWAVQRNGDCGTLASCDTAAPGVLRAYDAANLTFQLYSSDQAAGDRDTLDYAAKFSVPLVANGKVFVGSMSKLTVYGLLP